MGLEASQLDEKVLSHKSWNTPSYRLNVLVVTVIHTCVEKATARHIAHGVDRGVHNVFWTIRAHKRVTSVLDSNKVFFYPILLSFDGFWIHGAINNGSS